MCSWLEVAPCFPVRGTGSSRLRAPATGLACPTPAPASNGARAFQPVSFVRSPLRRDKGEWGCAEIVPPRFSETFPAVAPQLAAG
jgi:hypothetical protein